MIIKTFSEYRRFSIIKEAVLHIDQDLLDIIFLFQHMSSRGGWGWVDGYEKEWSLIGQIITWAAATAGDIPDNQYDYVLPSDDPGLFTIKSGRQTYTQKIAKVITRILTSSKDQFGAENSDAPKYIKREDIEKILSKPDIIQKFADEIIGKLKSIKLDSTDPNLKDGRKIELYSGKDIIKWYDSNNPKLLDFFSRSNNSGYYDIKSCMSKPGTIKYLNFYANNPSCVQLLVITKSGKLDARALVWKLTDDCDADYLIDRCYCRDKTDAELMYSWLKMKYPNSKIAKVGGYRNWAEGSKDVNMETFKVKLDNCLPKQGYPYLDTLRFLFIKKDSKGNLINDGYLINQLTDEQKKEIELERLSPQAPVGKSEYIGFESQNVEGLRIPLIKKNEKYTNRIAFLGLF